MLVENLHKLLIFRFKLNSKELLFLIIALERLVEDVQEDLLKLRLVGLWLLGKCVNLILHAILIIINDVLILLKIPIHLVVILLSLFILCEVSYILHKLVNA